MTTIALPRISHRASLWAHLRLAYRVWQERQALRRLDSDALRDLGLSRDVALAEARLGFLQLPAHRL